MKIDFKRVMLLLLVSHAFFHIYIIFQLSNSLSYHSLSGFPVFPCEKKVWKIVWEKVWEKVWGTIPARTICHTFATLYPHYFPHHFHTIPALNIFARFNKCNGKSVGFVPGEFTICFIVPVHLLLYLLPTNLFLA